MPPETPTSMRCKGGIDIPIPEENNKTVTANAAVVVYFDMEEKK